MNLKDLREIIEQVLDEKKQINEAERHQTDKAFRPVTSAVITLFSGNEQLRELSADALDKIFAIIYEDLN
jgi:hypothetical protein